jgi:membrane protease YdiL (CAAX protease family)
VPPLPEVAARVLVFAAAAYFGGLVVLRLCAAPLAGLLTGRIHDMQTLITCEAVLNIVAGLLSLVAPAAVLVYMGRRIGLTAADIGLGRLRPLSHPLAGIAGYCAVTPLLLISVVVSGILFEPSTSPMNPAAMEFALAQGVAPRVLLTILGCVMAPFTEELVFRGIFLRALQPANGFLGAAVLTSLVFALLHPQLPAGFLSIFVLGLAFSLLYGLTRSLWPSMVAHAINNGLVFVYLSLWLGK